MGHTRGAVLAAGTALCLLLDACGSSGSGGREVQITQTDNGCTPTIVQATPGEKLKLVVKNESGKDSEIEGEDGSALEEVLIPSGKTRTPGFTVPDQAGTSELKCYIPGGVSTIIEVRAG